MTWDVFEQKLTDACINTFSEKMDIHLFNSNLNSFDVVQIAGTYTSDFKQVDLDGNMVSTRDPMVEISVRVLPRDLLKKKDKIKARGILYDIREIQKDSSGAIKVYLTR